MGRAHSTRLTRQPGQRFEALNDIRKAIRLGRETKQSAEWFENVRDEAIGALLLPDTHVEKYHPERAPITCSDFTEDLRLSLFCFSDGDICIRRLVDNQELAKIPRVAEHVNARFIGGDRVLQWDSNKGAVELWNIGTKLPRLLWNLPGKYTSPDVSQDCRLLAIAKEAEALIVQLENGAIVGRVALPAYTREPKVAMHPTLPYIAVWSYFVQHIEVHNWKSGEMLLKHPFSEKGTLSAAWSPDGRRFVAISDTAKNDCWLKVDPVGGQIEVESEHSPSKFRGAQIAFSKRGDRLIGLNWGNGLEIFDPYHSQELYSRSVQFVPFASLKTDTNDSVLGFVLQSEQARNVTSVGLKSSASGHATFAGAKVAINMCDHDLALELLNRPCNQMPEAITPRQWRSYLLTAMGRWAEAQADIDWVLEKIEDVSLRLMRVELLYRQTQFDKAIDECTKLIEDPAVKTKRGLSLRSLCYEATGNHDAAQTDQAGFHAKLGNDLSDLNDAAYHSVGFDLSLRCPLAGLKYAGRLDKLMAERSFTTSDELKSLTYYRDTLGLVYYRNDHFDKAIHSIAGNLDPANECYREALCVSAMSNAKLGNWDIAQRLIHQAKSASSSHPDDLALERDFHALRHEAERLLSNRPATNE